MVGRVSSKWKKNVSVRTETNRNKICFAFVSVCFVKPKQFFFGLFRCFEPISKQPKQTELFRNEPKQSGIFWKIPKYALYQNLELLNGVWMWENRSETLKEYTYDTSGFGRACAPVHCTHPSLLRISQLCCLLFIPQSFPRARTWSAKGVYLFKLLPTELNCILLSYA